MIVVLCAKVQDDSQLQELRGVDAVCGRVVLLDLGQLVSSCIAVVLDELPELCALRDVLGLLGGELEAAKLLLYISCRVGGSWEEIPQQCKECTSSITIIGVVVVGLGVRGDEAVCGVLADSGQYVED